MNSLEIREAKVNLINDINDIALPSEVKRMMLKEILLELEIVAEKEINALLEKRKAFESSDYDQKGAQDE